MTKAAAATDHEIITRKIKVASNVRIDRQQCPIISPRERDESQAGDTDLGQLQFGWHITRATDQRIAIGTRKQALQCQEYSFAASESHPVVVDKSDAYILKHDVLVSSRCVHEARRREICRRFAVR